jgi:hypothetical protein
MLEDLVAQGKAQVIKGSGKIQHAGKFPPLSASEATAIRNMDFRVASYNNRAMATKVGGPVEPVLKPAPDPEPVTEAVKPDTKPKAKPKPQED